MKPREVVLVGGGHAHIHVLEGFAADPPPDARLTVVADTPIAVYSGMVPGFVAGQYTAEQLQIDVGPLARRANAEVVVARAVGVDPAKRRIELEGRPPISYDLVSFDIGSIVRGLDLPGVREHALPTRPIGVLVERVDEMIERARQFKQGEPFHVMVVGGGAGGVELAFTFQHRLARETQARVRVSLLDSRADILTGWPRSLVGRVGRLCDERGIDILCNRRVAAVEPRCVVLADGQRVDCQAMIWVAGATGQSVFVDSGLATDSRGFLRIRSTLQAERHDDIFAVGDCATLIDFPNTPKAGVYAVRQGPIVTDNLRAVLAGEALKPYRPQADFLMLLNLGDGRAVGAKWGRSFEGRWVMRLKDWIDRRFMRRFQIRTSNGS